MTMKVHPIYGDNPGPCQVWHGGRACGEEAVVRAEVPIPGEDGTHVLAEFCRQDWAEVVEKEELDLRKIQTRVPEIDIDEAIRNGEDEGH